MSGKERGTSKMDKMRVEENMKRDRNRELNLHEENGKKPNTLILFTKLRERKYFPSNVHICPSDRQKTVLRATENSELLKHLLILGHLKFEDVHCLSIT